MVGADPPEDQQRPPPPAALCHRRPDQAGEEQLREHDQHRSEQARPQSADASQGGTGIVFGNEAGGEQQQSQQPQNGQPQQNSDTQQENMEWSSTN
ncbi:unnamed protein product [Callosobruchus maculatus]|uniref:Uncharacterized protein n=1 Tax=Callosobruchus maculatus TaxID=64391 RepID=A0A653BGS5_CALMS|nr:unnamed protein product [Callosobruchus maculatus]